ncbi:hypothetical protein ACMA1I_16135 [Pontibacter sp. 13R65]|uniref:hypothetical protein n=1 Tax=Pontibacter sp. 13R65 TaxID=3127458 RepID=UPI00301C7178
MTTIVAKRHPLKFYLTVGFAFLFFCGMGTLMAFLFLAELSHGDMKPKEYLIPAFSAGSYFVAVYTVIKYFKNAPIIRLGNGRIAFGDSESYQLSEVVKVRLTGKKPFSYLISFPMEGAMLQFRNGSTKYFYDDMYANTWQLKSFLEQVVVHKKGYAEVVGGKVTSDDLRYKITEEFKGNQFTSLRGISLWGLIGFFLYLMAVKMKLPPIGGLLFFGAFGIFWFFLNSWLMHYFEVAEDYFVVRNHNLLWRQHIYRLSNMREVVFETQGKMPNCLRVITKDYRNNMYPAGTLRDSTWLELKERLEKEGVVVRNECIY